MTHQQGKPPTEEDIFYQNWGQETVKNNINLCNEVLKQLITISSALLGVTIIYEKIVSNELLKVCVLLTFFLSLIIALFGLLPYERKVNLNTPQDIKTHKRTALQHKRTYLWISAIAIVAGFGLIIGELTIKILFKQ